MSDRRELIRLQIFSLTLRSHPVIHTVKKVDKSIMFCDIYKKRPMADDFFGDIPQCFNQTDISLTSASGYLLTNVHVVLDFIYNLYIYIYI